MRRFVSPILFAVLVLVPIVAKAGPLVEFSLGQGYRLSPSPVDAQGVNFMVAPGYSLAAGMLKLELGIVGNVSDVQHREFDLNLRPMLVVSPPLLPIYGRAIFAIQGLVDSPVTVAYGGAVGASFGVASVSVFGELGLLPRVVTSNTYWVMEWRLGVGYEF